MNPHKPRYSIAAKRIWPLFVPYKGWPFNEILSVAQSVIGKRVIRLTYGLESPPRMIQMDVAGIETVDIHGTVYTGKASGACEATVRLLCHRVLAEPHSGECINNDWTVDAAELYETVTDANKELSSKDGVIAEAFDKEWTNVIHFFNRARDSLAKFEEWGQYFIERGMEHPITNQKQRDYIERIRKCLRSYEERTAE